MTTFNISIAQRLYKLVETTLSNIQYTYIKNDVTIFNKKLKGEKVKPGHYKARQKISERFMSISAAQKELKTYVREAHGYESVDIFKIISNPSLQKLESILKMNISILETSENIIKMTLTKNRSVYGFNPESLHVTLGSYRNERKKLIEVRLALNNYIQGKSMYDRENKLLKDSGVVDVNAFHKTLDTSGGVGSIISE